MSTSLQPKVREVPFQRTTEWRSVQELFDRQKTYFSPGSTAKVTSSPWLRNASA